jgi:hypothetical protein
MGRHFSDRGHSARTGSIAEVWRGAIFHEQPRWLQLSILRVTQFTSAFRSTGLRRKPRQGLPWESTKMRATPLLSRLMTVRCRTTSHEHSTSTSSKVMRGDSKRFGTICATLRGPKLRDSPRLHKLNLQKPLRVYFEANRVIGCYGMGITQHIRGTPNVQQLINLLLLRGNIGRPGAGIYPADRHSNMQGDLTVGITARPTSEFLERYNIPDGSCALLSGGETAHPLVLV